MLHSDGTFVNLLGRDNELTLLEAACDSARAGRGQLVILSGEAGIGKSSLAAEITARAAREFVVTHGRAWELGETPAYFPVRPCLRSLEIEAEAGTEADAFHLWEEVLGALGRAAAQKPILWVVEDLHAGDAQTLDLLCFLAQPLRSLHVLLLLTLRRQDPRIDAPVQKRLVRLLRDAREIPLHPLGAEHVAELAARNAGHAMPGAVVREILARTGGNPLFVVECARVWRAGGDRLALPPTIEVLVQERIELLPERTRSLLSSASVLGNEFSAAILGAMCSLLPARVIDDLQPAARAGIVLELEPGQFRFSHALVRDAVFAAIKVEDRMRAHGRAEAALATAGDDPRTLVERAHHAVAGRTEGCDAVVEKALALLERQGTFDRAFALCQHWLEVQSGAASLVRAANLALAAGHYAKSRKLCLDALAVARAHGDHETFARAALAFGSELQAGIIDSALVHYLQEAQARLAPDSPWRCRVSARLAAALQPAPDPAVPMQMARTAIAEARAAGDEALLRDVLLVAPSAMIGVAWPTEVRSLSRELLARALPVNDHAAALRAYFRLILAEMYLGDFEAMDLYLDEMLRMARTVGHPRLTWRALLLASMRAIARGRFDESERLTAEVQALSQLTDDPSIFRTLGAHLQLRSLELHQTEVAPRAFAAMDDATEVLPTAAIIRPLMRALTWVRLGDPAGAARAFAGFPVEKLLTGGGDFRGHIAEVCAAIGTSEQQRLARQAMLPIADQELSFGPGVLVYSGPVRRVLGLLDGALGERKAAADQLRAALELSRRRGLLTWVSRIAFELGSLEGSRELLEEAATLADSLGIAGLARRARERIGIAPAPTPKAITQKHFSLTREGEVWRVAHGETQIRVQHSRGMELLARLVERPGEEIHVLALASDGGGAIVESDAGELLDAEAAHSYRRRLTEIETDLADAEANADAGHIERLVREREYLRAELSRAFGLGATARRGGSASERARVNVQRRIKDAISRIDEHDRALGDYLRAAIRTGTYCTFRP
ncbi:MAG TPA: AAA family ATPase [Polyangiaceae bacterium]